ncbi:hypothetical protein V1477_005737 [Vespula maculifrons]|uniref:Uncharacterized protein n=1 Tax=Vespula maculifrons TaxID=7453 RepID=A0ABD2CMX6_VESMC
MFHTSQRKLTSTPNGTNSFFFFTSLLFIIDISYYKILILYYGNEIDFRDRCHPNYYFVASGRRYFTWLKRADTREKIEAKAVPIHQNYWKQSELSTSCNYFQRRYTNFIYAQIDN